MAPKEVATRLDKEHRKRLEQLEKDWDKSPSSSFLTEKKLDLPDLRLLLEHFPPLQRLIRDLIDPAATPSSIAESAALAPENPVLKELQARCQQLAQDLETCRTKAQKLLTDNQALEARCQQLESQGKHRQAELEACQSGLRQASQALPEIDLLRQDREMAQTLGLADLPAQDTQALIQVVAVLAQRENLERVWQCLKARCEDGNRAATRAEIGLLDSVLRWYNHNWQSRPYRRIEAAPRSAYDYERHQRSRHTSGGDAIQEQRLPGIADGSGKPLCKALVCTQ